MFTDEEGLAAFSFDLDKTLNGEVGVLLRHALTLCDQNILEAALVFVL